MHLCLIDDDARLLATLQRGLRECGHECETFQSAAAGLERLRDSDQPPPDLLLLDVMMPDMNGWDLLAHLREDGLRIPAIYLTARQEINDRVHGLELGADDYVIKPFAFSELIARIQAVLRRHGYQEPLTAGKLRVHRTPPRVELDGKVIATSPREHAFLELLAAEPDRVFSRPELLKQLWEIEFDPGTNLVDVFVTRLRRKLGPRHARLVETAVGRGYCIPKQDLE